MAKKPVTPAKAAPAETQAAQPPATAAPVQPRPVPQANPKITLGELSSKREKLEAEIKAMVESFSAETGLKVLDIGLQSALDYKPGPTPEAPETVTRVYNATLYLAP